MRWVGGQLMCFFEAVSRFLNNKQQLSTVFSFYKTIYSSQAAENYFLC
jgi:hypothetical protein